MPNEKQNYDDKQNYNDTSVYLKMSAGKPLSSFDWQLILDSNSIENPEKQKYENILTNIALNEEYNKEKQLEMANRAAAYQSIVQYMAWKEKQNAKSAEEAKIMRGVFEELEKEDSVPIYTSEENWLLKSLTALSPPNEYPVEDMHKHIEKALKENRDPKIDMRTIKAVLELAKHSPTLRDFIFPAMNLNPNLTSDERRQHCQQHYQDAAMRILDMGKILKNIHCHDVMKDVKAHIDERKLQKELHLNSSHGKKPS